MRKVKWCELHAETGEPVMLEIPEKEAIERVRERLSKDYLYGDEECLEFFLVTNWAWVEEE